jgi:hypothetical protein
LHIDRALVGVAGDPIEGALREGAPGQAMVAVLNAEGDDTAVSHGHSGDGVLHLVRDAPLEFHLLHLKMAEDCPKVVQAQ